MISFDRFMPTSGGIPIYRQIILYIKRGMVAGTVTDGDELPSRRVLSALLGINPNTVQKAYRTLEAEGLILSHSGAKSYVSLPPEALERVRRELLGRDARSAVHTFRQMGLTLPEAQAALEAFWDAPDEETEVPEDE